MRSVSPASTATQKSIIINRETQTTQLYKQHSIASKQQENSIKVATKIVSQQHPKIYKLYTKLRKLSATHI